jgi:hypothetical protein
LPGVTGASERLDSDAASARLQALRARASVPVVAGFGIKDAASAAAMARQADGVVVGSALVAALAEASSAEEAAQRTPPSWPRCGRRWTRNGRAGRRPASPEGRVQGCRPAAGTHWSARKGCRPAAGTAQHLNVRPSMVFPAARRWQGCTGGESGARLSAFAALGPP